MELNHAIALRDREEIKDEYPEEYALYERVKLYSVLAVPVKPRPCGFLTLRNPTRYVDETFADVLQLLAFVALVNINDIMQHRMRKLVRSSKDIKSANDIYIKLFGNFELIADKGSITATGGSLLRKILLELYTKRTVKAIACSQAARAIAYEKAKTLRR